MSPQLSGPPGTISSLLAYGHGSAVCVLCHSSLCLTCSYGHLSFLTRTTPVVGRSNPVGLHLDCHNKGLLPRNPSPWDTRGHKCQGHIIQCRATVSRCFSISEWALSLYFLMSVITYITIFWLFFLWKFANSWYKSLTFCIFHIVICSRNSTISLHGKCVLILV